MASPYDDIPYPGYPHAQTHPDRLSVLGVLHGLDAAPPEQCRVLEIGCGNGGNLVPMAYALPGAALTGIDIAAGAIAEGRALAGRLGLRNLRLLELDLTEATAELGEFDYVVAHGVYSWIPAPARDRLMALCREVLAPQGIAYLSYNALPGGRVRQMLRDMLLFHIRDLDEPQERIDQARAFAEFLSASGASPVVEEEIARLRGVPDWLLYHDDLAEVNDAVSLQGFAQHASDCGLQFLAEADFFEMDIASLAPHARELLQQMEAEEVLLKEQYLDFLTCRRFRQTLLCREEVVVNRPSAERLGALWVACRSQPLSSEATALRQLAERWPGAAPAATCGVDLQHLLELYASGVVELHGMAPKFTTTVSDRPQASLAARLQAGEGTVVANLRHEPVDLENEGACRLLSLLDGEHSCTDIQEWLGADPLPALQRFARLALLEA